LIRQTVALRVVALYWVTADEEYGKNGAFLDEVERLGLRYVVEVPVNTTVWTEDPAACVPPPGGRGRTPTRPSRESVASVAAVASGLSRAAWQPLQVRDGAKGPLAFEFAAVRVRSVRHRKPGPPFWLLVLDELGYVPARKVGAELLFDVISTAYERSSVVVTTNLPFEEWKEVLGSERLTGATLDRLTHRCTIVETGKESYRLRDARRRRRGRPPGGADRRRRGGRGVTRGDRAPRFSTAPRCVFCPPFTTIIS
jgi:hypothetical protein